MIVQFTLLHDAKWRSIQRCSICFVWGGVGGSYNSKLLSYIKQSFTVASVLNLSLNHNQELK